MSGALPDTRRLRPLVTPEGVQLALALGDGGQRLAAFLLDLSLIAVALVALTLGALALGWGAGGEVAVAIWVIGFFLLRNFWFAFFELSPRAATPGKRMLGLRVVARDGGRLTGDAILARNLTRELELFLPLTALGVSGTRADWWLLLLGLGWTGMFLVVPLLNRDRLRVGDLLAGTWVVLIPRPRLLADLAAPGATPVLVFTPEQRRAYGIKELHVLEEVLRHRRADAMAVVADRVRHRINWSRGPAETDGDFLVAFYGALRGELERNLLFGKRREDKHGA